MGRAGERGSQSGCCTGRGIGWGDAFAEKEIGTRLVGSDELGGGTASECDSMDVVGAIYEETYCAPLLAGMGKRPVVSEWRIVPSRSKKTKR